MTWIPLGTAMTLSTFMMIPMTTMAQTSVASADEKTLFNIERALNDADARHDADEAAKYLDESFMVRSFENGRHYDKKGVLETIRDEAKSHHKDTPPTLDALKANVTGGSALVTFNYIVVMDRDTLHCQMEDNFLKRAEGWKLVKRAGTCKSEK